MRAPTEKERAFCHAFTETGSLAEAHARAYGGGQGRSKARAGDAARILARPAVQAYLAGLSRPGTGGQADSLRRVIAEYERIAFADLGAVLGQDEDGMLRIDSERAVHALAAAIQEFSQEEAVVGEGKTARRVRKTRVKLLSKLAALEALTKCLAVYDEAERVAGERRAGEEGAGEAALDPAVQAIIDTLFDDDAKPDAQSDA